MTREEFNAFCAAQPHSTHVVQWGGADVWKIGGKVFAIGRLTRDVSAMPIVFKVSDLAWEILRDAPGCRPAPYLASRGMKWIERVTDQSLDDEALREYITDSYRLVANGLTKKLQREFELIADGPGSPSKKATTDMSITLYGLKNCDTCKKAIKALQTAGREVVFVDIREEADLGSKVPEWLSAVESCQLTNTRSTTWRNLSEADRARAVSEPAALLQDNPTLIKRPVIEAGNTTYVGWTKDVQAALT